MSLRVLLADESASIRKVFQLGLQDFGAEVKSVHNGLDVIEVAEEYKPDIIFADILLQKKNGYEVSEEIRNHSSLNLVPVVLMWSSFMELDHKKYEACAAQGELEKPFDVDVMRKLITQLVKATQTQKISQFLEFPDSIKSHFIDDVKNQLHTPELENIEDEQPNFKLADNSDNFTPESTSEFNMKAEDSSFEASDFEVRPYDPAGPTEDTAEISMEDGQWVSTNLSDNNLSSKPMSLEQGDFEKFQSMDLQGDKKLNLEDFLYKPERVAPPGSSPTENTTSSAGKEMPTGFSQVANVKITGSDSTEPNIQNARVAGLKNITAISVEESEAIIRQETRILVQKIITAQLPAVLEKVIRDELHKVLEQELALKSANPNP